MDQNMLLEMAKLLTNQQIEIDRLKALIPTGKKNKKRLDNETKQRRISLIEKLYDKQWQKVLIENSDKISFLNHQLSIAGMSAFIPNFDIEKILKTFK